MLNVSETRYLEINVINSTGLEPGYAYAKGCVLRKRKLRKLTLRNLRLRKLRNVVHVRT